ncbi:hypothetical protein JTE90_022888 [Oedothorax gibbosus]|uniref:Diuretic hormone receptor n=1 Tax=Oedothorax gibbosus TaxID=931172 RepID=A0AAV6UTA9_9ARAC|nr:hypothetical protein JTE90_022888 [Oedothorax gibbosus]
MLQENENSIKSANNVSIEKDPFEDIGSLEEADCYLDSLSQEYPDDGKIYCNVTWDGISCWPITAAGSPASVPCFEEFNGVRYDTNTNASRECLSNGSWVPWSNYRGCKPLTHEDDLNDFKVLWDMKEAATIYYVGYGISLVALSLALFVFFHFKDLRCLRNTIHTNLMITYLLLDLTWIITATLQSNSNPSAAKVACILVILLTYLMATNFFWMFVEGLYLYMLVVETFSIDKIQFRTYVAIGWGIPAFVAAAWAIVKGTAGGAAEEPLAQRGCPWQNKDYYDYVFSCPVMLVLLINIFFLAKIMWVLITKLRASNTVESKQYRKAAKALLVLIPLLGVTYIVVIATPSDPVAEVVFIYIQATLLSIQGFVVAVLYCFLNGEVQNSLRHHLERWKIQKSVGKNPRQSVSQASPHHGESIALYNGRGARESCTSFSTTTTVVNLTKKSGSSHHLAVQDDML